MHQKNAAHTRKREKQTYVTPFTCIDQRHSQQDPPQICLQHSQPLQFICLSCGDKILCNQCIAQSIHASHDFKHIQRNQQLLKGQFQQWRIKLKYKNQMLEMIHDQLGEQRQDKILSSSKYIQRVRGELELLARMLMERLEKIQTDIKHYLQLFNNDLGQHMLNIREKRKQIQNLKDQSAEIQKKSVQDVANLYIRRKKVIDSILHQDDINFYKHKINEVAWTIDEELLKNIQKQISKINVQFRQLDKTAIPQCNEKYQKNHFSKKKSKKALKLSDFQRFQIKPRNSHSNASNPLLATFTPKNLSKDNKFFAKKSPEINILKKRKKSSAKMVSMPASPSKQMQKSCQITPDMSRKKLFKKKQK